MSLTVIGTRESSPVVRSSSDRLSRCCSWSCATAIWGVLIELKQTHLPVFQSVRHAEPSPVGFGEGQHRLAAPEQSADCPIHGQDPPRRPRAHDRDLSSFLSGRCLHECRGPVASEGLAALLFVFEPVFAALQSLLLLLEHGVESRAWVGGLGASTQLDSISKDTKLRQMAVALPGHRQLRADQVREVTLELLDPPLRVLVVFGSHFPVPPLD